MSILKLALNCVLANFSTVVHHNNPPLLEKKINMASRHYLMTSALNFISFKLKKWNFAVILSLKHKWVVKRLKFGSYFMINCGETGNDIFRNFWFLNSFRLTSYLKLTGVFYWSPQFLSVASLASRMYQLRGKCQTLQNHAYIKQLLQELMKCYFQSSVGDTCCLLFMNQCLTKWCAQCTVSQFIPI